MSPEFLQQEDAVPERGPAGVASPMTHTSGAKRFTPPRQAGHFPHARNAGIRRSTGGSPSVVAFKFGGSSLLGAERMLHAASIVRSSAPSCSVVVIVSAMKGVTDHLLAVGSALENGKLAAARDEAEGVINTHLEVLRDLQLDEDDDLRVRR